MTAPAHVKLERVTRVSLLGLGLWDPVSDSLTSEGLTVRVYPLAGGRRGSPVVAHANRRGVFVATSVPGLEVLERGAGDDAFWSTLPASRPYLIEIRDTSGDFLSAVLHLDLPVPRGLVLATCMGDLAPPEWSTSSPPMSPPSPTYVPLFSGASRRAPGGMAMVRASLIDAATGAAASFAVLDVSDGSDGRLLARAVADERGEVAAIFPYPEVAPLIESPPSSPPASPQPLAKQEWKIDVAVRYARDLARYATDPLMPALPDLCEIVAQPPATISTTSPPGPLTQALLRYGAELLLGADSGGALLITPT